MSPSFLARVRWANVAIALVAVVLVGLVAGWPLLSSPGPQLPSDTPAAHPTAPAGQQPKARPTPGPIDVPQRARHAHRAAHVAPRPGRVPEQTGFVRHGLAPRVAPAGAGAPSATPAPLVARARAYAAPAAPDFAFER